MSGKQHKREIKRQKEAARQAARRKQRQASIFTGIVVAIVIGIGAALVVLQLRNESVQEAAFAEAASEFARQASEAAAASEGPTPSEGATPSEGPSGQPAVRPITDRPVACGGELPAQAEQDKPTFDQPEEVLEAGVDYGAVIETSCGPVTVDLLEDDAPQTVNSFVFLAQEGFFDGLALFRNATTIGALQTGSGTNEATWDIGYTIPDELAYAEENGYPPGTLAMANSGPDSGGSQFFFVYNDQFTLEPTYAAFAVADPDGAALLADIGGFGVESPQGQPGADPGAEAPSEVAWIESVRITSADQ